MQYSARKNMEGLFWGSTEFTFFIKTDIRWKLVERHLYPETALKSVTAELNYFYNNGDTEY